MGTTSEKLTYLNTTKTLIKDNLNLGGANISNEPFRVYSSKLIDIYKDFLANGTDTLWNNWEKVSGSGTEITLNNTIEAKMDFVYKGNTYQETTTGKNLINDYDLINRYKIASVEGNLLTSNAISSNYDTFQPMTHYQKISLIENSDYYVSFDCRLKSGTYGGRIGRATIINTSGQALTINDTPILNPKMSSNFQRMCFKSTANTSTSERIAIMLQVQENLNSAIFEIKNIMISTSSDTTYEPYTNGASPNPDYPQDIQVVSGDNTIKVEGKNLCNGITQNYFVNQAATRCGYAVGDSGLIIEVDGVSDYTISSNTVQTRYRVGCLNEIPVEGGSNTIVYNGSNKDGTDDSVTINTNGYKYLVVNATDLTSIQIEKNSTKTLFEEYKLQTYPINLGNIELCKIGDYQDYLYKDSGKWYLNKQIGKVVYNGSESGRWTPSVNGGFTRFAGPYISNAQQIVSRLQMESNYFHYLSSGDEIGAGFIYAGQFFAYPNQTITTEQNFRNWLSTHNTTVYYVLATPTITEITDTTLIGQLDNLENAYSYDTQTNISQTNDDMPFILDVVALGELEI